MCDYQGLCLCHVMGMQLLCDLHPNCCVLSVADYGINKLAQQEGRDFFKKGKGT